MRKYFYVNESTRFGPVSREELRKASITTDTLVWFDTLTEWKAAGEVPELADLFENQKPDTVSFVDTEPLPTIPEMPDVQNVQTLEYIKSPEVAEIRPLSDFEDATSHTRGMFSSPFSFDGRIRRTEYWLTCIISNIVFVIVGLMMKNASGDGAMAVLLIYIPIVWLLIAQNTKRCHDRGNSGWFQLIPFYSLWMAFAPGEPHSNEYGPNPKG